VSTLRRRLPLRDGTFLVGATLLAAALLVTPRAADFALDFRFGAAFALFAAFAGLRFAFVARRAFGRTPSREWRMIVLRFGFDAFFRDRGVRFFICSLPAAS
jgi:uncharacterized membrane protein